MSFVKIFQHMNSYGRTLFFAMDTSIALLILDLTYSGDTLYCPSDL